LSFIDLILCGAPSGKQEGGSRRKKGDGQFLVHSTTAYSKIRSKQDVVVDRWWIGGGSVVDRWWIGGGSVVDRWWIGAHLLRAELPRTEKKFTVGATRGTYLCM